MELIEFRKEGLYCPQGDFYIDPWRPVNKALITHAHGDHARWGHRHYLAHHDTIPIMKVRLGDLNYEGIGYNELININGVNISFHPAGHIIGSSQIRLEYKGEVWVVSGDYKTEYDNISPAFEPVKCHTFITESTFGLPVYRWQPQSEIFADINGWWQDNIKRKTASVIFAYSLGKAQRILANIDSSIGPVYLHGAVYNINQSLIKIGHNIPDFPKLDYSKKKHDYSNALIVGPPSAAGSYWLKRFNPYALGVASGWMAIRGTKRRKAADKGFALSDHADWEGLNTAIAATEAERVFVTHGYTNAFAQWLRTQGYDAHPVLTEYFGETADLTEQTEEDEATPESGGEA